MYWLTYQTTLRSTHLLSNRLHKLCSLMVVPFRSLIRLPHEVPELMVLTQVPQIIELHLVTQYVST